MSKYKLIMSDLDNTLLPIQTQEQFAKIWFRDIVEKFKEHKLDPEIGITSMNLGIKAMLENYGKRTNFNVFYDTVLEHSGYKMEELDQTFYDYYTSTFDNVRELTLNNPYAVTIAKLMNEKSEHAVVATMPIFPIEAVERRMAWVGLKPSMFDFITTFDQSSACKPSTLFYQEILDRFGVKPEEALMIGNDVNEDMRPCKELGIDTFLVLDFMITHDLPYSEFRQGGYADLVMFLERL